MKRLHPLVLVTRALQYAVSGLSVPLFLLAMSSIVLGDDVLQGGLLFALMGIGLLLGMAYGVLSYLMYTYEVTEDTFDLHSGVIGRREREIPLGRIQNVDLTRSFWHRLVGVAVVRIETAGGGTTEAHLDFVAADEAERLQRELRDRRAAAREETAGAEEGDSPAGEEVHREPVSSPATDEAPPVDAESRSGRETSLLFRLKQSELFLYAGTEIRPATLFLTALGTPLVERWVTSFLLAAAAPLGGPEELVLSALTPDQVLALSVVAIPLWLAGAWLVGAAFAFNSYHGFYLGRRGEDYVYERGLLSEYSGTIPGEKIQTLTLTENVLQRVLGYASLSIETAGYAGQAAQQMGNRSSVPLAERTRALALVRSIEGADLTVDFTALPKRARRRYAARFTIVVLVLLGITYATARLLGGFSLWWLPALLLPLVPVAAHYRWKHRGYAVGEDHLFVRSGFWRRRTRIVPYDRLQTAVRTRSIFQRRLDLAHLVADTASAGALQRGGAIVYDVSAETAAELRETLRARLQEHLRERTSR